MGKTGPVNFHFYLLEYLIFALFFVFLTIPRECKFCTKQIFHSLCSISLHSWSQNYSQVVKQLQLILISGIIEFCFIVPAKRLFVAFLFFFFVEFCTVLWFNTSMALGTTHSFNWWVQSRWWATYPIRQVVEWGHGCQFVFF